MSASSMLKRWIVHMRIIRCLGVFGIGDDIPRVINFVLMLDSIQFCVCHYQLEFFISSMDLCKPGGGFLVDISRHESTR